LTFQWSAFACTKMHTSSAPKGTHRVAEQRNAACKNKQQMAFEERRVR
jgi:hypothetical protein